MKRVSTITASAVPLDIANLDTDQIIPKQFLKTVAREGLGAGLFYDLRFAADGTKKADFVLNDAKFAGAAILVTGENFGCGSSREHAPWALLDSGFRCVVAASFAEIFYNNCFENGLLPAIVSETDVKALMEEARGGNHVFTVDLASQTITTPSGRAAAFQIDPERKRKLAQGLDSIGETLRQAAKIEAFEERRALAQSSQEGRP